MKVTLITASISLLMISGAALAGAGHSDSHEDVKSSKKMEHMDKGGDAGGHGAAGGHGGGGGHAHSSWEKPPTAYASMVAKNWDDTSAAMRGKKLYDQNCAACHGADGKGTGPAAAALAHPPADLTNNFHTAPGKGDGYLFWRISEGGQAEPFKAMKSSMPAFKGSLSEAQRWDTLVYVHQEFHVAFPSAAANQSAPHQVKKKSSSGGHGH